MGKTWNGIDRDRLARVVRLYHNNADAGRALGIQPNSFARLCRRFGIEQPAERKRREHEELLVDRRSGAFSSCCGRSLRIAGAAGWECAGCGKAVRL